MRKQDITYQDKLNELRLDISHPNSKGQVFIFVEGDSDIRLFRKLFNLNNCNVEHIPGGKVKLGECVETLLKIYPLIIAIRDADFLNINKILYTKPNVFITDYHDIEMLMVFETIVFETIIIEYTNIPKEKIINTRENIIKSIEQISLLKWLNEIENLEFKFEAGFQDLISFSKEEIDFNNYFKRIISKSPNFKINDIQVILNKINQLKKQNQDSFQLCNGHDFMKAMSTFIKEHGVTVNINDETLASAFRMVYSIEHFKKTNIYQSTKNWADTNACSIYL